MTHNFKVRLKNHCKKQKKEKRITTYRYISSYSDILKLQPHLFFKFRDGSSSFLINFQPGMAYHLFATFLSHNW